MATSLVHDKATASMKPRIHPRSLLLQAAMLLLPYLTVASVLAQPAPPPAPNGSPDDQSTTPEVIAAGDEATPLEAGPIHEAFAEPLAPGEAHRVVINQEPPPPLDEVPPDYRPEGENVQWIPGYWMWFEEKQDFIWVSGVWRAVPPGRFWTPGHWLEMADGYRWVGGYWSDAQQSVAEYLPVPPETLEQGPSSPPPSDNYFWVPGCWRWEDNRYSWRPGYWYPGQTNWLWVPDHYAYTPRGAVFVPGYWDYPVQARGMLYAPVYWPEGRRYGANYSYTPRRIVNTALLLSTLFIDGNRGSYYYGRGYGGRDGYLPWYSGYQTGVYSPLYSYYAWQYGRDSNAWQQRFDWDDDRSSRGEQDRERSDDDRPRDSQLILSTDQLDREDRRGGQSAENIPAFRRLDDREREAARRRAQQVQQYRAARAQFEAQQEATNRPAAEATRQDSDNRGPEASPAEDASRQQQPTRFDLGSTPAAVELRRQAQQRFQRDPASPGGQPTDQQKVRPEQAQPQRPDNAVDQDPNRRGANNRGNGRPPASNVEGPPRRPQAAPPAASPQDVQRPETSRDATRQPSRPNAEQASQGRGNAENGDRGRGNGGGGSKRSAPQGSRGRGKN